MRSALVLGPGGPVGTAWLAGLAAGLRRERVDLGAVDLIVGTSAGAIVGAILACGGDLDRLATLPGSGSGVRADLRSVTETGREEPAGARDDPGRLAEAGRGEAVEVRSDPERLAEVFAVLGDARLDRAEAVRRVGRLAVLASAGEEETVIAGMRYLVGGADWPDRPLLIPAVDAETGEAVVWDRDGAASLPQAVAASIAFPATAPPITIGGRRYIDGALRAGLNVDLAGAADLLIVAEPMAHLSGETTADERAVRLVPDAEAIAAFGPDITDRAAWAPAYAAGVRQAPAAARQIGSRLAAG
ncbi:patatin-like phospholipase family protein [Actinomadura sp. DC4]|uniref:patatin-like phospholipase family protein n=1 Tax=Actinomadura sp. DC4 TaxID=3055069 RepID=UPI0025AF818E|nr:patatin-like phospholipase family protein [Actinomadura sp. DC4]MDN3354210.1 patatin-like phospholipase family protein [Actinomadura sp. DC4]